VIGIKAGKKKNRLDMGILIAVFFLLLIGTLSVFSAQVAQEKVLRTHMLALPISAGFFLVLWSFNYQIFQDQWKIIYAFMLIILIAVLFFGVSDRGARSWFRLPFFSVQPAEFARIGLILVVANYLDKRRNRIGELKSFIGVWLLALPVFFLLMKQPDFSAVLTMLPIILIMLFCAGASIFHMAMFMIFILIVGILPVLWTIIDLNPHLLSSGFTRFFYSLSGFNWSVPVLWAGLILGAWLIWYLAGKMFLYFPLMNIVLFVAIIVSAHFSAIAVKKQIKSYQQKRIEAFLSPQTDPRGASYNILQAQIAIGSGGLFGKGLFSGSQSKLGFIPERHTDFILAVVGETFGFLGMFFLMGVYIFLMQRCLSIASMSWDGFGYFTACGIFAMFFVYFFINFGMLLGLFPVAGVPLPLISYGGSNLVATMGALGLLQSIYSRRYTLR